MSASILDRDPPPADQRIRYGADPLQFGDLRLPAGSGPHPCAVAIHGGFWRNRYSLDHLGHLCAALASAGIATWSIEYRRIGDPGGAWPGTFEDVALAARYIRDNAARHGIDRDRMIVIGHSAGGQLASWLASVGDLPGDSPIHTGPLSLGAVVSLAGVLDLRRAWDLSLSEGVVEEVLGGSPDEVPERYDAASPVELLPSGVQHLLVHGDEDEIVPVEISERYHAAANAHGDRCALLTLPATGHFALIDPTSAAWPDILSMIQTCFE